MKIKYILIAICLPMLSFGEELMSTKFTGLENTGWSVYEFGEAGSVSKISIAQGALGLKFTGGGGGQGLYLDCPLDAPMKVGSVISFEVVARLFGSSSLEAGALGYHIEFLSGGEVVARTDSLGTTQALRGSDLSAAEYQTCTNKHKVTGNDVPDLSMVDTLRFVMVAIQPEQDGSFGTVLVKEAKAAIE